MLTFAYAGARVRITAMGLRYPVDAPDRLGSFVSVAQTSTNLPPVATNNDQQNAQVIAHYLATLTAIIPGAALTLYVSWRQLIKGYFFPLATGASHTPPIIAEAIAL